MSGIHGSWLIFRGNRRYYAVPDRTVQQVIRRTLKRHGIPSQDHDDADWAEWEAFWELMDIAAQHWDAAVGRFLRTGNVRAAKKR